MTKPSVEGLGIALKIKDLYVSGVGLEPTHPNG